MVAGEVVDAVAFEGHFVDHIAPVWRALPSDVRGDFIVHPLHYPRAVALGLDPVDAFGDDDRPTIVASFGDHKRARNRGRSRLIVMEHGIGQSYGNGHGAYPGGHQRHGAALFLSPNDYAAHRWRMVYPDVPVAVVGSPRLDALPAYAGDPTGKPTVAVSFHWQCMLVAETRSAFTHYRDALPALASAFHVIGHGHPRIIDELERYYRRFGIEVVRDFDDVLRRADVYVCDNSSTIYEFASAGRPVVVLNAPFMRRHVDHGLRFWDAANVGVQIDDPTMLVAGVRHALRDGPKQRQRREAALDMVYARRHGAADAAADAIVAWLNQ